MNIVKVIFMTAITLAANSAFAEDGSERSQEFWKQFKISQEQAHGTEGRASSTEATVQVDANKQAESAKKSEG